MPVLSTVRTSSAYNTRNTPTKKKKNNTATLGLIAASSSKARLAYMTFSLPREVLDQNNVIESAVLVVHNSAAWGGNQTLTVTRILGTWTAGKLTWNNRPDVTQATSLTVSKPKKHHKWEIDVLPQVEAWRSGSETRGLRLATGSTASRAIVNSGDRAPRLVITYHVRPGIPTALSPANNEIVDTGKPILAVTDNDPTHSSITGMQVQMSAGSSWTTPDWDSGTIETNTPQIDLEDYAGAPAIGVDGEMYWRVRLRGTGNVWSSWSAGARYVRRPLPVVTLTGPGYLPNPKTSDPSPPISWTISGETQAAYRVIIRSAEDFPEHLQNEYPEMVWDSGVVASSDTAISPPDDIRLAINHLYEVEVRVWDGHPRTTSGGTASYASDTRTFTYELSAGVPAISNLTAVSLEPRPFIKLMWSHAETPDEYVILRNDIVVGRFAGPDLETDVEGKYEFVDVTAAPGREHTWIVRAVVNGETSGTNPWATGKPSVGGVWLSDPENDVYVVLMEPAVEGVLTDEGATHYPLRGKYGVRITSSLRGYAGAASGELLQTSMTGDLTGTDLYEQFLRVREAYTGRRMILSLNDLSFPVVPFNLTAWTTKAPGEDGDFVYGAKFEFLEVP